jgi:putative transposase
LKSAKEGQVAFDLAAVCHNTRGQRGWHQRETLLYATWGLTHRALRGIRATYRRRLGIESSYRQSHQARIRTSSRKPALRLLFLGVALVLRNVWVWLHAAVLAQPQRGARQLRPHSLRFARLLVWLMMEVAKHYRLLQEIPVYRDLYERAQAFGIVFNY